MSNLRQVSLLTAIITWATLIGAIVYSHLVFFPAYLHHLPESTSLVNGPYALHDERFWMLIHPITILSLIIALSFNWKLLERRKYLLSALGIYVVVLVITFIYFVPELLAFAKSAESAISKEEWLQRGAKWEKLSWVRGLFMYVGFMLLLVAHTKTGLKTYVVEAPRQKKAEMV